MRSEEGGRGNIYWPYDLPPPALAADLCSTAASPHVVIISQIDVEHELALLGGEVGQLLVFAGPGVVDGAQVDLVGAPGVVRLEALQVQGGGLPLDHQVIRSSTRPGGGLPLDHLCLQVLGPREAEVADVDVIRQGEGQLPGWRGAG